MKLGPVHADELDVGLTTLHDAINVVLAAVRTLTPRELSLAEIDGLVLARDVTAVEDIPRWPNSSMDGYAVTASETVNAPVTLDVAKIMTGHPLPTGSDAVVPWEGTTVTEHGVRINTSVAPGQFVRARGEDVKSGTVVMRSGTTITPVHIGALSALGMKTAAVYAPPRLGIICTGDEIVGAGEPRSETQIFDANGPMLHALLRRTPAVPHLTYAKDTPEAIRGRLLDAVEKCDAVITTGGASVGDHDWVRNVIRSEGEVILWRVALRPGKPFGLGIIRNKPVFVLPGNPASVLACTHAFVLPALRKMMGREPAHRTENAALTEAVIALGSRMFLCPVNYRNGDAAPMRLGSSSVLSNHLDANGYVTLAPGNHEAGERVVVELLG